jgi:hypothetical protein
LCLLAVITTTCSRPANTSKAFSLRRSLSVGASGHFCLVAKKLRHGPGRHEIAVAAKEIEFEMPRPGQRLPIAADVIRQVSVVSARNLQRYGEAISERFGTRALNNQSSWKIPDRASGPWPAI